MSTEDIQRQNEADRLAQARTMVKRLVHDWDWMTWNEILADDVVLTLKLTSVGLTSIEEVAAIEGGVEISGRDEARKALKAIYGDLKNGASVTTEIVSGYDFALFGALRVNEAFEVKSYPIATFIEFSPGGLIQQMTIATIDLHPLLESIRGAAQTGEIANGADTQQIKKAS
jgi:hypothetical protein